MGNVIEKQELQEVARSLALCLAGTNSMRVAEAHELVEKILKDVDPNSSTYRMLLLAREMFEGTMPIVNERLEYPTRT